MLDEARKESEKNRKFVTIEMSGVRQEARNAFGEFMDLWGSIENFTAEEIKKHV